MHRLAKFRAGRRAIHMHLSNLRPSNKRADRVRIAINTFEFLVRHFEGQIFALNNADIIFICNGGDIGALDDAVMRIRHLFGQWFVVDFLAGGGKRLLCVADRNKPEKERRER